ncbi:MAG: dipeptide epimerase [Bacteroidota bacterium]
MYISVTKQTLAFQHPFRISRSCRTTINNAIAILKHKNFSGYGEATANAYYHINTEKIEKDLLALTEFLATYPFSTPEKLWEVVQPQLAKNTFALCALDEAAHDLYGKLSNKPLHDLWNLDIKNAPLSNYTLGIDEIPLMVKKMKATPWPVYKIKLGTEHDLEIVKALRKETDAFLRVDANCGWEVDQSINFSKELKKLGVEFIEQPLPATDLEGMKEVFKHTALPIIADESCILEQDVEKCEGYFHGVNIKLMKCGGITPARRMIAKAKLRNMKVMVGCMTESSVGISPIAHLAPSLDYVDMDGAMLIKDEFATGIQLEEGKIMYNGLPGTGASLNNEVT